MRDIITIAGRQYYVDPEGGYTRIETGQKVLNIAADIFNEERKKMTAHEDEILKKLFKEVSPSGRAQDF